MDEGEGSHVKLTATLTPVSETVGRHFTADGMKKKRKWMMSSIKVDQYHIWELKHVMEMHFGSSRQSFMSFSLSCHIFTEWMTFAVGAVQRKNKR